MHDEKSEDRAPDIVAMTDAWVRELATSPLVGTRRRLVREVVSCVEPLKQCWLELLILDGDEHVRESARCALEAHVAELGTRTEIAELESRFAEGVQAGGFSWEWECSVTVWRPREGPHSQLLFLPSRDVHAARARAMAESDDFGAVGFPHKGGVFVRSMRLVCEYTRSARTMREAMLWKHEGRPRPPFE